MSFFRKEKLERGFAWWVVVVAVAVVIIASAIAASSGGSGSSTTDGNGTQRCYTYCAAFVELECSTNKLVGGCFGLWSCNDHIGQHECL